jgi:hypothetical protein
LVATLLIGAKSLIVLHLHHFRHDGEHRHRRQEQRVAIRMRPRHDIGRQRAAGADLVLDQELLADLFAQALRDHARDAVGIAARGERHGDDHRPRRPGLRMSRAEHARGHETAGQREEFTTCRHRFLHIGQRAGSGSA